MMMGRDDNTGWGFYQSFGAVVVDVVLCIVGDRRNISKTGCCQKGVLPSTTDNCSSWMRMMVVHGKFNRIVKAEPPPTI